MISSNFEHKIWIFYQINLSARTRKEYWNVIKNFDKVCGHDPYKLTRKEAMHYYSFLLERVNAGRLSYNTAVTRLSVMRSICDFIEEYSRNHGRKYNNYFSLISLPEQDKILPKDSIPTLDEINELLSLARDCEDDKAFLIFALATKIGLTTQEISSFNREFLCRDSEDNLCINFPVKNKIKRVVLIPKDIAIILDGYIDNHEISSGAVFLNNRNNRIKVRDIERLLVSYTTVLVKKRRIRKHYTMQILRHAAISYMLKGGADKDEVASYAGITTKWMNRYETIISSDIVYKASDKSIITISY